MKSFLTGLACLSLIALIFCGTIYKDVNKEYLRIHIRANSNEAVDQNVKYEIKDAIVEFLTPVVANCNNFEEVKICMSNNLENIDRVANIILTKNGFSYRAKSKLAQEEFPTRDYNGFVLESGIYDAIIVELGDARGDNWWCVVYPPLCFTCGECGSNVIYRSRIVDMINNFINK